MKSSRKIICLILLGCASLFGKQSRPRCYGDGPVPLTDISSALDVKTAQLRPSEAAEELVWLQEKGNLVYRDPHYNLHQYNLHTHQDMELGEMDGSLDPLIDPQENYVLQENKPFIGRLLGLVFDWDRFIDEQKGRFHHLFWDRKNNLYTLRVQRDSVHQILEFYRYTKGSKKAESFCKFSLPAFAVELARGSKYPVANFYYVHERAGGRYLQFYEVNVERCDFRDADYFEDPFPSDVLYVHRFHDIEDSLAVVLDHPEKNVMWSNSTRCYYPDLEGQDPLLFTHTVPVLGSWSKNTPLVLHFPNTMKKFRALQGLPISDITRRQIAISGTSRKLILSPLMEGDVDRSLMEITVKEMRKWHPAASNE